MSFEPSSKAPGTTRQGFNAVDRFVRMLRSRRIRRCLSPTDVVLDFGCGQENWFLRSTSKAIASGVGVDPHLDVDLSHDQQPSNIQSKRCTIDQFALDATVRFDAITWLAVIEHFHNEEAESLLRTCRSLLKPDGKLILTTPTPRSKWILEFLAFRLHLISEEEIRDHKIYYERTKMKSTLERSGFSMDVYQSFQFGLNSLIVALPNKAEVHGS
jgi:2-polyprenyl-3-methyl-5-hydroxy-6-metoxy-1,4-benzoquinol methylase